MGYLWPPVFWANFGYSMPIITRPRGTFGKKYVNLVNARSGLIPDIDIDSRVIACDRNFHNGCHFLKHNQTEQEMINHYFRNMFCTEENKFISCMTQKWVKIIFYKTYGNDHSTFWKICNTSALALEQHINYAIWKGFYLILCQSLTMKT